MTSKESRINDPMQETGSKRIISPGKPVFGYINSLF